MKKQCVPIILMAATAVFLAAALTACGGGGKASGSVESQASPAQQISAESMGSAVQEASGQADALKNTGDSEPAAAESGTPDINYLNDQDFLANVRYGLEDRWSQVHSQDPASMDAAAFREYAGDAVQAEVDAVGELYYYRFDDNRLSGLAAQYMNALESQQRGIAAADSQEELAENEDYLYGAYLRAVVLYSLQKDYGLTVDEKYQQNFANAVARYQDAIQYLGMEEKRDGKQ